MADQKQESQRPSSSQGGGRKVNGVDTQQLFDTINAIKADPAKGSCKFFATTRWKQGTVSDCTISHYELGGQDIPQNYTLTVDEPAALLGANSAPNPQMVLFAALNSCVLNTFIINAAVRGLRIESLEFETQGELDLRGFLGIDDSVNPGYDELHIICRVKGQGSREELQKCLDAGTRYSPNFQSLTRKVSVKYSLEIV